MLAYGTYKFQMRFVEDKEFAVRDDRLSRLDDSSSDEDEEEEEEGGLRMAKFYPQLQHTQPSKQSPPSSQDERRRRRKVNSSQSLVRVVPLKEVGNSFKSSFEKLTASSRSKKINQNEKEEEEENVNRKKKKKKNRNHPTKKHYSKFSYGR